jgi:Na+/H+ antiporter NhaC
MDNIDIIVYSAIIFISFISFIVMTIREFNEMNKSQNQSKKNTDAPSN